MRHAKSSWKDAELIDHDRTLNKRGKKDAPRMGKLLRKEKLVSDLILTSSARRARDTAEAVADESGYSDKIHTIPDFYQADLETFFQNLNELSDEINRVLIVGHNPELEEFVETLTGEALTLPTAALVQIELPIQSWRELSTTTEGRLVRAWYAREIA
jgi:phosphohistidine phosphatase